jgi:hypothetical protein
MFENIYNYNTHSTNIDWLQAMQGETQIWC